MSLPLLVTQLLNGLTLGVVLILVAIGLTLIFGMMDVINFAHGSLYMLGAYVGLTLANLLGNFWLALLIAPLMVAGVATVIELLGLRPLYGRDPLYHLLLTFGLSLVFRNAIKLLWGTDIYSFPMPEFAVGIVSLFGVIYPKYRLFVLVLGALLAFLVWAFIRRTKYGLVIRAGPVDRQMVDALGINVGKVFTWVFVAGSALAAAAGVIVAPMRTVYPEMGIDIIIDAFIVVVIGGLGSMGGAIVGALILGIALNLGALFMTEFAESAGYIVMALVLLVRPTGLFGQSPAMGR